MKIITLLVFTLSLVTSCQISNTTETYEINGTIVNIPDSTQILIYMYPDTDMANDSTIILNEKFNFSGKLERPQLAMLRIESTRDRKMFWLENNKIEVKGEKGDLINGIVSGSKSQEEANLLLARKDSIYKEMKELGKLVNEKNRDSLFVIYEKMEHEELRINKEFIKEYPNSYESLFRLKTSKEKLGSEETKVLFSLMNKELQATDEGESITNFTELYKNPKIGDQYTDFEQDNIHGQPIVLSEKLGKYTLVEFWASWCGPCRATNPELLVQYELYKEKGFQIIGVSLDTDKEKWLKAVEKDGLVWENVSDLKGGDNQVAMMYGVNAIPDNILIDDNGIIVARYITGHSLKIKLKELFGE